MPSEFKVGDRVRIGKTCGVIADILDGDRKRPIRVKWDDDHTGTWEDAVDLEHQTLLSPAVVKMLEDSGPPAKGDGLLLRRRHDHQWQAGLLGRFGYGATPAAALDALAKLVEEAG